MKKWFFLSLLLLFLVAPAKGQFFAGVELGTGYNAGYNWRGAYLMPNLHIGGGPLSILLGYTLVPSPESSSRNLSAVNEGRVALRMTLPARDSKLKFVGQYSFRIGSVSGQNVFQIQPSSQITTWTTRYHILSAGAQYNLPKGFYLGALFNFGPSNWDNLRTDAQTGAVFNIGWKIGV